MLQTAARAGSLAALACLGLLCGSAAMAGPSDYVHTPVVEEGEREIDFKAGTAKSRDGTRQTEYSVGLGLGVTDWWFTEVYAKWHKEPGDRHRFDAWEWENRFQLTETGKYPIDVGLLLEIERPQDRSEGYEYRWGPLLQGDITPEVQANLNLLFTKHIRSSEPSPTELGYEWQLKYRWRSTFEYGVQGFGNVGHWDHWNPSSEQEHIVGPAVFGRIKVGERQAIKYNAGVLFGLNHAAPRNTVRMQVEYEF